MKIYIYALLFIFLYSCQTIDQQTPTVTVMVGKLRQLDLPCGKQLVIESETGERLIPYNIKSITPLPEENVEVQVVYREVMASSMSVMTDSCSVGQPVLISHITKI